MIDIKTGDDNLVQISSYRLYHFYSLEHQDYNASAKINFDVIFFAMAEDSHFFACEQKSNLTPTPTVIRF